MIAPWAPRARSGVALAAGTVLAACSAATGGRGTPPAAAPPAAGARPATELVPAGYGSLRQENVAVTIRLPLVLVRAIPLDESIIRLLSPDSYRALRGLRDGRQDAIARSAARLGVARPSLWYVSFFGLEPDARFTARDIVITSGGREFRPLDVIPLTAGFSEERVGQRQVQSAIYLFDTGIDPDHPLTIAVEGVSSAAWADVIPVIERERALVRARSAARP